MLPVTYVINLDREPSRWKAAQHEIRRKFPAGLRIVKVPAVDGRNMESRRDPDWAKVAKGLCTLFCTPAQISCAMSHLRTWKQFLDTTDKIAMVCEDDVSFIDEPEPVLMAALREVPDDFDILYAGCNECDYDQSKHTWWGSFLHLISNGRASKQKLVSKHIYVPHIAFGTHCYLVSRKGAAKLSQLLQNHGLDMHIDFMLNAKRDNVNMYAIHPKIASQQCVLSASSIAEGKHPTLINMGLDKLIDRDGTSWAYKLTVPAWSVGEYLINGWTFIILAIGLASRMSGSYRKTSVSLLTLLIFVPDVLTNAVSVNMAVNMLLFLFITQRP